MNRNVLLLLPLAAGFVLVSGCQTATKPAAPVAPAASVAATPADPFWPADGVFPVPGQTSGWDGFRAKNTERRTLFAQHKAEDYDGIVFVGDSITEGWHTLKEDFAGLGVKVVNRGIGGDTTPNLVYRLSEDVLSLRPKALVIMIGTNDLGQHTSPAQISANHAEMLKRIRAVYPTIPIAWCTVMPRGGDDDYPARIHELNARLAEMVKKDQRITLVDTFTPLAQPDGTSIPADYVPDRLHLNPAGYAVWKQVLYPVVEGWKLK